MQEGKFSQEHYKRIYELASLLCSENDGVSVALTIDHLIEFICNEKNGDKYFEGFLRDSVLPKWIGILEDRRQLKNDFSRQLTIREHCYRLSHVLVDIDQNQLNPSKTKEVEGEIFSLGLAADWLGIASGIDYVSIIMGYYDSSLMFCSSAREYEDERSNVISHLALQLTIFNFVWGSFETIAKVLNLPKVPKNIKQRSSLIDQVIFFLKNKYEPSKPVTFYDETLYRLKKALSLIPAPEYHNLEDHFKLSDSQGVSGIGINVVRRIRNQFAHGAKQMPVPGNKNGIRPLDAILVELSTRIVLHTTQMVLLGHLKGRYFDVDLIDYREWGWWGWDDWEEIGGESIEIILRGLHIKREPANEDQLSILHYLKKNKSVPD